MALQAAPAAPTTSRKRLVVWLVVLGVFLVASAWFSAGLSRGWCSGCHAMRPFARSLAQTSHRGVGCVRCHGPGVPGYVDSRGRELGTMLPRFLLSFGTAEVSGPAAPVGNASCVSCHSDMLGKTVTARGLRIRHSTCITKGQSCVDCHSTSAHGSVTRAATGVSMDACVTCHDGTKVSAKCDLCHAAKLPTERIVRGVWSVTHGPDWRRTHGLGDLRNCRICHAADYCSQCHSIPLPHPESFPRTHGQTAVAQRAQCAKCHDEKTFCQACHGLPMPHPAGFLPAHSKIAKSFDDRSCARCHPRSTCDACHVKHTHPGSTRGTIGGALPRVGSR